MVRRVFVCQGLFCSARGSRPLLQALQARLAGCVDVTVEPYWCFNGCSHGPNVVLHDERCWYEGVGPDDVEPIGRHAETGQPTGRACGGRIPSIVKENAYEALDRKYPVPGDDPPGAEREASLGSDAG